MRRRIRTGGLLMLGILCAAAMVMVGAAVSSTAPGIGAGTGAGDAARLPWPSAVIDKLYLPLGLQFFMDAGEAKGKMAGFGEPACGENACRWQSPHEAGTVFFEQVYGNGQLVGFKLDYVLMRDVGLTYAPDLKKLKEAVQGEDWIFVDRRNFLEAQSPYLEDFAADCRESRLQVKWREGEHSVFITMEMSIR